MKGHGPARNQAQGQGVCQMVMSILSRYANSDQRRCGRGSRQVRVFADPGCVKPRATLTRRRSKIA